MANLGIGFRFPTSRWVQSRRISNSSNRLLPEFQTTKMLLDDLVIVIIITCLRNQDLLPASLIVIVQVDILQSFCQG